jgi:hypothetical protein
MALVERAEELRAMEGLSWREVAARLEVAEASLMRWRAALRSSSPAPGATSGFERLRIGGVSPGGPSGTVSLVAPSGWRIEGASLAEAAVLLGLR